MIEKRLVLNKTLGYILLGMLFLAALWWGWRAWQASQHTSVLVEWTTASEMGTAGFNLYRSESQNGPFTKINPTLIPASLDPLTGGSYQYEDKDARPGQVYFYQLEEVETNGNANRLDTTQVKAENFGWVELAAALLLALASLGGLVWLVREGKSQDA